jgi:tRNA A-37 threonylcarbamoyl transferase component Bud32
METYTKSVREKELRFFRKASEAGISPTLISFESCKNGRFALVMERHPIVLIDVLDSDPDLAQKILNQAKVLVKELHQIDILHNDLSEENIVYNPSSDRTYLIDFGLSVQISTIDPDDIPSYVENLYEGRKYATEPPSNTTSYLCSVELGIISFLQHGISKLF